MRSKIKRLNCPADLVSYQTLLRPSSNCEPSDPPLVVVYLFLIRVQGLLRVLYGVSYAPDDSEESKSVDNHDDVGCLHPDSLGVTPSLLPAQTLTDGHFPWRPTRHVY